MARAVAAGEFGVEMAFYEWDRSYVWVRLRHVRAATPECAFGRPMRWMMLAGRSRRPATERGGNKHNMTIGIGCEAVDLPSFAVALHHGRVVVDGRARAVQWDRPHLEEFFPHSDRPLAT